MVAPQPLVCVPVCVCVYACIRTCVCGYVCGYMYGYAGMQVYRQGCGRTHSLITRRSSLFYSRSDRGEGSTLPPTPLTGLPLSPSLGQPHPGSLILVDHGESFIFPGGSGRARGDPDQTRTHALCGGARGGEGGETWACARGVRGRGEYPRGVFILYFYMAPAPTPLRTAFPAPQPRPSTPASPAQNPTSTPPPTPKTLKEALFEPAEAFR